MNHTGLIWKIGTYIRTGNTCWFNGILFCGIMPDIYILHSKLKNKLLPGERVIAEEGYRGDPRLLDTDNYRRDKINSIVKDIRTFYACNETINGCLR